MNPRMKALLWEECHTGGLIAGWCFLLSPIFWCGVATLGGYHWSLDVWRRDGEMISVFAIGVPMAIALLLLLAVSNSGHLKGGFPSRILLLPVDAWEAVTAALGMRLLFTGAVSLATVGICHLSFGDSPGVAAAFMVMNFYLLFQTLDWARRPAPALVALLVGTAACFTIYGLLDTGWGEKAFTVFMGVFRSYWTFMILAPLCFVLSWASAAATRQGVRLTAGITWRLPQAIPWPAGDTSKPFSSPESAVFWYQLRTTGVFIPWLWLIAWSGTSLLAAIITSLNGASVESSALIIFEILPLIALPFAMYHRAFANDQSRFLSQMPVSAVTFAHGGIKSTLVCFLPTWLIASTISTAYTLWGGDTPLWGFIQESMKHGESGFREWALFFAWPPLLMAVAPWNFAHPTGKIVKEERKWNTLKTFTSSICVLLFIGVFFSFVALESKAGGHKLFIAFILLCLLFCILSPAYRYIHSWRVRRIGAEDTAYAACIWLLTAAVIIPAPWNDLGFWSILVALTAGAIVTGGYPAIIRDFAGLRNEKPSAVKGLELEQTSPWSRKRRIRFALILYAVTLLIAWLRWPAEPAVKATWRAANMPASLE